MLFRCWGVQRRQSPSLKAPSRFPGRKRAVSGDQLHRHSRASPGQVSRGELAALVRSPALGAGGGSVRNPRCVGTRRNPVQGLTERKKKKPIYSQQNSFPHSHGSGDLPGSLAFAPSHRHRPRCVSQQASQGLVVTRRRGTRSVGSPHQPSGLLEGWGRSATFAGFALPLDEAWAELCCPVAVLPSPGDTC